MNKTQGYVIAAALVITLVFLVYGPSGTMAPHHNTPLSESLPELPDISAASLTSEKSATSVNIETNKDTSTEQQQQLETRIKNLKMPSKEKAREEVAKNPHVTPKALIQTAYMMSQVFDDVKDEASAKSFLEKMRECSNDTSDTPIAVKSSCIRYLDRLEKKFPQLKTDIDHAREQASQEARELEKISR